MRKYLPDFKVRDESVSRDVTVWNLLTHTAGWEGQVSGPERGEDTLRNFVATVMPDLMQVAPPTAAWSYNNAGFSVSGRVIEAVTGTSINRAIATWCSRRSASSTPAPTAGDFIVNRFAAGHVNRARRRADPAAAVLAVGQRHGRRRRPVHRRSARLREVPSRRRHHAERRAAPEPRLARDDADDAAAQAEHRRRHRPRVAFAQRRTAARRRARRHARRSHPAARARSRAQLRDRHPDQLEQRLAADPGRRARSAEELSRRDVPEELRDRASRAGRDAAERRAAAPRSPIRRRMSDATCGR